MATTIDELQHDIDEAISSGFRGRLLDRGQARAMIWKDGVLPPNAPEFSPMLSYDLLSYGYSLLGMGMRLRELEGNPDICRAAFEKAASSIQDVVEKGNSSDSTSGFHNVLAASAYHLAGYSAKAYSLINKNLQEGKISPVEKALCFLILREFNQLETDIWEWKLSGIASDGNLADILEQELDSLSNKIDGDVQLEDFGLESVELPVVDLAITDKYYSALSLFFMAHELGEKKFIEQSLGILQTSLSICTELNLVPHWWIHRITIHLLPPVSG